MGDEPAEEGKIRRDAADLGLSEGVSEPCECLGPVGPCAISFAIIGS